MTELLLISPSSTFWDKWGSSLSAAWSCSSQTLQQDRSGGAARVSAHWPRFVPAFSLKKDCGSNKAAVDYFSESMWATDKITCRRNAIAKLRGSPEGFRVWNRGYLFWRVPISVMKVWWAASKFQTTPYYSVHSCSFTNFVGFTETR